MSFTAEVKDELSRIETFHEAAEIAQLSALLRVSGTLSFRGSGRYALRISTETGAVARVVLQRARSLFNMDTLLTPRRSILHKTRNYLIEIPEQEDLEQHLVTMGILAYGKGLTSGLPRSLLTTQKARIAFMRGAFLAGGFIANPQGDIHMEIAVTGEQFSRELAELIGGLGIPMRLSHRRGSYVLYLKSYRDIRAALALMGASRSSAALGVAQARKTVKNDVNRRLNAELANQTRSSDAAAHQLDLIQRARALHILENVSPALQKFCEARESYPWLSLADLGARMTPSVSKSALYHRILRLEELVLQEEQGQSAASSSKDKQKV